MIFRHAENKDIISIHNIGQAIFGIHNWSINSIKKYLYQYQNKKIWVYEFKNKIIGYIIEQRCQNEIDLLSIAIDKTFQSKGFGKIFLIKFLQNLNSVRCRVRTCASEENRS